jgi:hypothetical protein
MKKKERKAKNEKKTVNINHRKKNNTIRVNLEIV